MRLNELNRLYKSESGDRLAVQELLPVVRRFLGAVDQPAILEVGCGYGRNLVALSTIPGAKISGCDISQVELAKARERLLKHGQKSVTLVHQDKENQLPFSDSRFDVVVAWQLLEHILAQKVKRELLCEMTRVVKDRGVLILETPNFWFPLDYHDNRLPFAHWFLPVRWRYWLTRRIRDEDFPPSQYVSLFELRRWLRSCPGVREVTRRSAIYFEKRYRDVLSNLGGTNVRWKKLFFVLYTPLYLLFRIFHLPGDLLTPSLRLVFEIRKSTT